MKPSDISLRTLKRLPSSKGDQLLNLGKGVLEGVQETKVKDVKPAKAIPALGRLRPDLADTKPPSKYAKAVHFSGQSRLMMDRVEHTLEVERKMRSLESSVPGLQGATLATFSHLDDVEARIRQLQENLQRSMKEEALEEARQKALQSGSEEVIEDDTLKPPDTPRTKIMKAVYHTDDTVAACRYCGRDIIKEYLAAHEQNCKLVHHLKEAAAQKLDVELLVCEICGQRVQSNRMKAHQASAKCKQRSHEPGAQSSLVVGTTTRVYGGIEEDEDSDDDAEPPQAPQEFKVKSVGCDYIEFMWKPPIFDGGAAITDYAISYSEAVPSGPKQRLVPQERPLFRTSHWLLPKGEVLQAHGAKLYGLKASTEYLNIRVFAINKAGMGEGSKALPKAVTATPKTPSAPSHVRLKGASATGFRVAWDPPFFLGGTSVEEYEVEYKTHVVQHTHDKENTVITTKTERLPAKTCQYAIDTLRSDTLITNFHVRVVTVVDTFGDWSPELPDFRTKPPGRRQSIIEEIERIQSIPTEGKRGRRDSVDGKLLSNVLQRVDREEYLQRLKGELATMDGADGEEGSGTEAKQEGTETNETAASEPAESSVETESDRYFQMKKRQFQKKLEQLEKKARSVDTRRVELLEEKVEIAMKAKERRNRLAEISLELYRITQFPSNNERIMTEVYTGGAQEMVVKELREKIMDESLMLRALNANDIRRTFFIDNETKRLEEEQRKYFELIQKKKADLLRLKIFAEKSKKFRSEHAALNWSKFTGRTDQELMRDIFMEWRGFVDDVKAGRHRVALVARLFGHYDLGRGWRAWKHFMTISDEETSQKHSMDGVGTLELQKVETRRIRIGQGVVELLNDINHLLYSDTTDSTNHGDDFLPRSIPPLRPVAKEALPVTVASNTPDADQAVLKERENAGHWDGLLAGGKYIVSRDNVVLATDGSFLPARFLEALECFETELRNEEEEFNALCTKRGESSAGMVRKAVLPGTTTSRSNVSVDDEKEEEEAVFERQKFLRLRVSDCYSHLGRYDKAMVMLTSLKHLCQVTKDDVGQALAIERMARCYRLKGALTEAAEKARMAAGQWGAIEDHGGRIRSLQLLVQIKREEGVPENVVRAESMLKAAELQAEDRFALDKRVVEGNKFLDHMVALLFNAVTERQPDIKFETVEYMVPLLRARVREIFIEQEVARVKKEHNQKKLDMLQEKLDKDRKALEALMSTAATVVDSAVTHGVHQRIDIDMARRGLNRIIEKTMQQINEQQRRTTKWITKFSNNKQTMDTVAKELEMRTNRLSQLAVESQRLRKVAFFKGNTEIGNVFGYGFVWEQAYRTRNAICQCGRGIRLGGDQFYARQKRQLDKLRVKRLKEKGIEINEALVDVPEVSGPTVDKGDEEPAAVDVGPAGRGKGRRRNRRASAEAGTLGGPHAAARSQRVNVAIEVEKAGGVKLGPNDISGLDNPIDAEPGSKICAFCGLRVGARGFGGRSYSALARGENIYLHRTVDGVLVGVLRGDARAARMKGLRDAVEDDDDDLLDEEELREKEQALIRAADREQEKLYDGLGGHSRTVTSIVIGSKYVFTGSADWSIRKWDPTTYKCRGIFRGHVGTVWALDIDLDNMTLVSGGADRAVRVWNTRTRECLKVIRRHDATIKAIAIWGDTVVSASNDGVLGVWSLKALEVVRQEEPEETLSPAKQKLRGVKSSPSNSSETSKKQKKNRVPSLPPLRRAENLSLVDLMPIVSKARRERRGSVGMKIGRNPHKRYDNINGFRNFELDEDEEQEMLRRHFGPTWGLQVYARKKIQEAEPPSHSESESEDEDKAESSGEGEGSSDESGSQATDSEDEGSDNSEDSGSDDSDSSDTDSDDSSSDSDSSSTENAKTKKLKSKGSRQDLHRVQLGRRRSLAPTRTNFLLRDHEAPITCLDLRPPLLATGDLAGKLILWDTLTGTVLREFNLADEERISPAITSVRMNDFRIVCGTLNGDVEIRDLITGGLLSTLRTGIPMDTAQLLSVAFDNERILAVSSNGVMKHWKNTGDNVEE